MWDSRILGNVYDLWYYGLFFFYGKIIFIREDEFKEEIFYRLKFYKFKFMYLKSLFKKMKYNLVGILVCKIYLENFVWSNKRFEFWFSYFLVGIFEDIILIILLLV